MPIIAYACESGHLAKKFFRRVADAPARISCEICSQDMKKQLSAPNSTSKITIDNGSQARAVEVNPDIIAINKERSEKNYSED